MFYGVVVIDTFLAFLDTLYHNIADYVCFAPAEGNALRQPKEMFLRQHPSWRLLNIVALTYSYLTFTYFLLLLPCLSISYIPLTEIPRFSNTRCAALISEVLR